MQIKFKATGEAPDYYSVDGESIIAHHQEHYEVFNLSSLGSDDRFEGVKADTLRLAGGHIIRSAYRDNNGELCVTLCQEVGPGNWTEGEWMDVVDYNPDAINVVFLSDAKGTPFAVTRMGAVEPSRG